MVRPSFDELCRLSNFESYNPSFRLHVPFAERILAHHRHEVLPRSEQKLFAD